MRFYIPIGDPNGPDARNFLVEGPSMERVLEAQTKILENYGKNFFQNFANSTKGINDLAIFVLCHYHFPFTVENSKWSWGDFGTYPAGFLYKNGRDDYRVISEQSLFTLYVFLLNCFGAEIRMLSDVRSITTLPEYQIIGKGLWK